MSWYEIILLVFILLSIQAVFYLFFYEKRALAKKELGFICIVFSAYALFSFLFQYTDNYKYAELYYRFLSVGRSFFPFFLTYLFFKISKSKSIVVINILRYYLLPAFIVTMAKYLFLDFSKIADLTFYENSWIVFRSYTSPWLLFVLFNLFFCMSLSVIILYNWKKRAYTNREKTVSKNLCHLILLTAFLSVFTEYVLSFITSYYFSLTPFVVAGTVAFVYYAAISLNMPYKSSDLLDFLIFEQINDFVLFMDLSGKVINVNNHFLKILKYDVSDIKRLRTADLFSNPSSISQIINQVEELETSELVENEIISRDNTKIPVVASCLLNKDSLDNPIGIVLYCIDNRLTIALKQEVAERVKRERELLMIKRELESLVEKKTKQLFLANEQLKHEIYERERVEEQINSDLNKKITLIQEIHHRVKNNIQIIISLVNMLASHKDIEKEASGKLYELSNVIRSISSVHESFYSLPQLSKINFGEYLKRTAGKLYSQSNSKNKITFRLNIRDELLDINKAITCGIIFVEIMSNAINYAFPDSKQKKTQNIIEVEYYKNANNKLVLTVSDNGVGMKWDKHKNKVESIGLQLVSILVKDQLKGEFEIICDNGTRFYLVF